MGLSEPPPLAILGSVETAVAADPDKARQAKKTRILGWTLILGTTAAAALALWSTRPHAAVIRAEDIARATLPPRLDGTHPCVYAIPGQGSATAQVGRCATPVRDDQAIDRFEVDLRYGTFVLRQTDLATADGGLIPLTRTYASQDWGSPSHEHAFGLNSSHNWDIAPTGSRWPYTYMTLMLPDSDFLYFRRISAGTSFANAVYLHTETSTPWYKAVIAWNGDGWTLRRTDGAEMRFPEAYASRNLAQGAACERKDAAGHVLHLRRDRNRNLQEVLTANGHWIRFTCDDRGRILQAEDDRGELVRYGYNSGGLLAYALHASGAERMYEYQGPLMTAVLDEHGTALVRNAYRAGLLVAQHFADGELYTYDYTPDAGARFMDQVIVTLPDRSQRTIPLADAVPQFVREP